MIWICKKLQINERLLVVCSILRFGAEKKKNLHQPWVARLSTPPYFDCSLRGLPFAKHSIAMLRKVGCHALGCPACQRIQNTRFWVSLKSLRHKKIRFVQKLTGPNSHLTEFTSRPTKPKVVLSGPEIFHWGINFSTLSSLEWTHEEILLGMSMAYEKHRHPHHHHQHHHSSLLHFLLSRVFFYTKRAPRFVAHHPCLAGNFALRHNEAIAT